MSAPHIHHPHEMFQSGMALKYATPEPTPSAEEPLKKLEYISPEVAKSVPALKRRTSLSNIRYAIREPLAEFIGVALLVIMGAGADAQVVLSTNKAITSSEKGDFLSANLGWAIGLALAVWASVGVSQGHVNPAITLAQATWGKFPWKKVPVYILAQTLGGLAGAGVVYAQFVRAIDIYEGGRNIRTAATAGLWISYPAGYLNPVTAFFAEFLGAAILTFMIISTTDGVKVARKEAPPSYLVPFVAFFTLLGLGVALGMQTAFAFNPARDFGPRVFLAMAGYGKDLFAFNNHYWIWCPILAPIAGAQCAQGLYELLVRSDDLLEERTATGEV